MKLLRFLLLSSTLFLLFASHAQAQLSVYGTVMLTGFGVYNNTSSRISFDNDTAGIGGGAFYNFPIHSRLTAGIDGRGSYSPGAHGGENFAAALRIGFVPHQNRLRPYFQIGGGVVSAPETQTYAVYNGFSSSTYTVTNRITNGALDLLFGLDIRLTSSLDLRAIEYGAAAGSSNANTHTGLGFLDSGLVYHFGPSHPRNP